MKDLFILPTKRTPEILFKQNGEFIIRGSSFPEDVAQFYNPVINWLNEFKLSAPPSISLIIDVDYLNTSSLRNVFSVLKTINSLKSTNVAITWIYEKEDDDMFEQGEIFQSSLKMPFIFIEKILELK